MTNGHYITIINMCIMLFTLWLWFIPQTPKQHLWTTRTLQINI